MKNKGTTRQYAESKEVLESALSPKCDLFIISPMRSEEAHVEEETEGVSEGTDGSKEIVIPRLNKTYTNIN